MIAKKKAPPISWTLIEEFTGRNLANWELGDARVVVIELPERELHPSVAAQVKSSRFKVAEQQLCENARPAKS